MNAEAPRSHLNDGIGAVLVKIFVQAALSGVIENTEVCRRTGQRGMGVITDRAVTHSGEHQRHGKFDLRGECAIDFAVFIPCNGIRFLA